MIFLLKPRRLLLIGFLLLHTEFLLAAQLRLRAREHFDRVTIQYNAVNFSTEHSGIGPTINLWWEEPYVRSIGLAVGAMFINEGPDNVPGIDRKLELWKAGLEGKHYWSDHEGGLFGRWGGSYNRLINRGLLGNLEGYGAYLGLGWEFQFENIGLAFEAAQREVFLEEQIRISSYSPSIGVHFYGYL